MISYILDWIKEVDCHCFAALVELDDLIKIVRIMIQMMIWANERTSATQDVGTKST